MLSLDDTISAISTPVGDGGIGIVRLSGPQSEAILRRLCRPVRLGRRRPFESHRMFYGHVFDPESAEVIDEVLAVLMRAPTTYTREDVAEIHCHGSIVALNRVLALTLRCGARLAQPGEFTLRAFVNGRIDLAQAEAVLDLIRAKTDAGQRLAMRQLQGALSEHAAEIRSQLITALAHVEASLDFPDDEIPSLDIASALHEVEAQLGRLIEGASKGMVYRNGLRVAIVGRPNVGKSSLLNALLRTDRAIVTHLPGTTRDTLEEMLNLRGVPLVLVDTAGIASSAGLVESLGIERSCRELETADLVILVLDGSQVLQSEDFRIASLIGNKAAIVVVNKMDIPLMAEHERILPELSHICLSALTGVGLNELEEAILAVVFAGGAISSDPLLVSNPRHVDALRRTLDHVSSAAALQSSGAVASIRCDCEDILAFSLRAAVTALGEITGETVGEDVLDAVFAEFCIGK